MQRLRDKLAISERTAKAEAQLKVSIRSTLFSFFCLQLYPETDFDLRLFRIN